MELKEKLLKELCDIASKYDVDKDMLFVSTILALREKNKRLEEEIVELKGFVERISSK